MGPPDLYYFEFSQASITHSGVTNAAFFYQLSEKANEVQK